MYIWDKTQTIDCYLDQKHINIYHKITRRKKKNSSTVLFLNFILNKIYLKTTKGKLFINNLSCLKVGSLQVSCEYYIDDTLKRCHSSQKVNLSFNFYLTTNDILPLHKNRICLNIFFYFI